MTELCYRCELPFSDEHPTRDMSSGPEGARWAHGQADCLVLLKAQVEALRPDAERYRYLRNPRPFGSGIVEGVQAVYWCADESDDGYNDQTVAGEKLDRLIDQNR